jgi:hypothetical protein
VSKPVQETAAEKLDRLIEATESNGRLLRGIRTNLTWLVVVVLFSYPFGCGMTIRAFENSPTNRILPGTFIGGGGMLVACFAVHRGIVALLSRKKRGAPY